MSATAASAREVEIDLERLILRDLPFDEPGAKKVWATLSPADFQSDAHGRIYAAWRGLASDGEPLDLTHLTIRLAGELDACGGVAGVIGAMSPGILDGTNSPGWSNHSVYSLALALKGLSARRGVRRAALRLADDPSQTEAILAAIAAAQSATRRGPRWSDLARPLPEFLATAYPTPESLIGGGLLARGDFGVLFGKPGLGKSWLALTLALAVARGESWLALTLALALARGEPWLGLERPDRASRVAVLSLEIVAHRLQDRLKRLIGERQIDELDSNLFPLSRPDLTGLVNILDPACYQSMHAFCNELRLDLLVLDAASRIHHADESDPQEMGAVLGAVDQLRIETGTAVLIVHHERKGDPKANGNDDDLDALRGSSRWQSDPTLLLRLKRKGGLMQLVCAKSNNGPEPDPVWLAPGKHGPPTQIEAPEKKAEGTRLLVQEFLQSASGWVSAADCAARIGRSADTVTRHFEALGCERSTDAARGRRYRLLRTPQDESIHAEQPANMLGLED